MKKACNREEISLCLNIQLISLAVTGETLNVPVLTSFCFIVH